MNQRKFAKDWVNSSIKGLIVNLTLNQKEVKYFNISFNVHKVDSATYSIVANGAGIRFLEGAQKAFLKKATRYLSSFDYYLESG